MTSIFNTPVNYEMAFRSFWKIATDLPHVGILVGDLDGYHLFSNRTFRQMFYADAQFDPVGKTIEQLEGKEVAEERLRIARHVCETGKPLLIRHTRLGTRVESVVQPWKLNNLEERTRLVVVFSRSTSPAECKSPDVEEVESEFNSWGELDELTNRQLEVLAALREGLTQKQAAKALGVTAKTIETHRDQLIRRLGITSTLDAIRLADRAGLTMNNSRKRRLRDRPWEAFRDSDNPPTTSGVA